MCVNCRAQLCSLGNSAAEGGICTKGRDMAVSVPNDFKCEFFSFLVEHSRGNLTGLQKKRKGLAAFSLPAFRRRSPTVFSFGTGPHVPCHILYNDTILSRKPQ